MLSERRDKGGFRQEIKNERILYLLAEGDIKKGSKVLSADGEGLSAPENFRTI